MDDINFSINVKTIQDAIGKTANEAAAKAFDGWEIQEKIRKQVGEAIVEESLMTAVRDAVKQIDMGEVTRALANELQITVKNSIISLMRESVAGIIFSIRMGDRFVEDKKKREIINDIKAEISSDSK